MWLVCSFLREQKHLVGAIGYEKLRDPLPPWGGGRSASFVWCWFPPTNYPFENFSKCGICFFSFESQNVQREQKLKTFQFFYSTSDASFHSPRKRFLSLHCSEFSLVLSS